MIIRSRLVSGALVAATVLATSACAAPAPSGGAAGHERVWRSDGYGYVYVLDDEHLETYETTQVSCIKAQTLTRTGTPAAGGAQGFGRKGTTTQALTTKPDGSATVHVLGTAADMDLVALPAKPPLCSRPVPDEPRAVFDVFWATFAENYNSLDRKGVDWTAVRDRVRAQVGEDTGNKQLFDVLRSMIEGFGDVHTSIAAAGDHEFSGLRPGYHDISNKAARVATEAHLRTLGAAPLQSFAGGKIAYTDIPDGRGYLRIDGFEGYDPDDHSFLASSAALTRILDQVFTDQRVHALRGLIVDVRLNSGGDDALGLQVASRLTDRPYVAFTKSARNDPKDLTKHTRPQQVMVTPADSPRYTGPVWVLISDSTISAGETFVEALMGRTPAPARIGSNTQGVFADDMTRHLPNGWTFVLGNEEYVAVDGHDYEGPGIPPTVPLPVFPAEELTSGRDSALDAAH